MPASATPTIMDTHLKTPPSPDSTSIKSETTEPSSADEEKEPMESDKPDAHTSPFMKLTKYEDEGALQLQHAVATTLFTVSLETLKSFVDPMNGTFKAVYKSDKQLVIWRKGNAVFIGIFEHHTSIKMFGFEHLVGIAIGWDGSWHLLKSAGNAFCEAKWPEVWAGKYRGLGGVNDMSVEFEGMVVEKGQRARSLAVKMLESQFWAAKVDIRVT